MNISQRELKSILRYNPITGLWKWRINKGNQFVNKDQIAGHIDNRGYNRITLNGKSYKAHRLAFLYMEGYFPENEVDHKNSIKDDNRWLNLREVSRQCNTRNRILPSNNTSGVMGVCFVKDVQKWLVQISIDKKRKKLGYYKNFDEAVKVRWKAEKENNYNYCQTNSTAYNYLKVNNLLKGEV